jgi:hypothetical protein
MGNFFPYGTGNVGVHGTDIVPLSIDTIWADLEVQLTPLNTIISISANVWTNLNDQAKQIFRLRAM